MRVELCGGFNIEERQGEEKQRQDLEACPHGWGTEATERQQGL